MKFSYVKEYGVLYLFFCAYWIYTRFAYFKSPYFYYNLKQSLWI